MAFKNKIAVNILLKLAHLIGLDIKLMCFLRNLIATVIKFFVNKE